ncbi:MAG: methyltransferase domain-containing protein, partial [Candidatus Omnitrophica bacterium]|nr:methyltransferase domain-containing protein [Candidatus Omnitrophota bacterium]
MAQLLRKLKRALFDYDPSFCDMHDDPKARAVAVEYLGHIRNHLHQRFSDQRLTILDAGCQAGRLLIPLAQDGHQLIGLDTSAFGLRRARRHAATLRLSVQLHRGDIAQMRRWIAPGSLDVVICAEVLYLCPNYRALLELLAESLKPGGLLIVSHRPALYYLACAMLRGNPEQAVSVARRREGPSPDADYHNWQTEEDLAELYRALKLDLLGCYPIDARPSRLDLSAASDDEVKRLLKPAHDGDSTFRIPT